MTKIIKLTEDQFNEFIDYDGSIIDGDKLETDNRVKTNYFRKNKRPQITDDFADETGQNVNWYHYRGFSVSEGVKNVNELEDNLTSQAIPDYTELSKSYQAPDIENSLNSLITQLSNVSTSDEQKQDVYAIVLKKLLQTINISQLNQSQQQEIKSILSNG